MCKSYSSITLLMSIFVTLLPPTRWEEEEDTTWMSLKSCILMFLIYLFIYCQPSFSRCFSHGYHAAIYLPHLFQEKWYFILVFVGNSRTLTRFPRWLFSGVSRVAQRLAPVSNTVRIGCPWFESRLGHAVLSLQMAFVYRAGFFSVINLSCSSG